MLHISLFSGIGGFDLAAQRAGWKNVVSCEINPWSNKLLSFYWPLAYHHDDIHTLTYDTINAELSSRFGLGWRNEDIIISGGFPCQPYSLAGKRLGKDDTRHLWPQMLRIILEISPKWIVGENVFGIVNWDGGLVFNEVQTDLEIAGYEVQPYVLPASGINAPHKRDRCFFIAHTRVGGDSRNTREISGKAKKNDGYRPEQSTASGEQVQLPNEPGLVFGDASNATSDGSSAGYSETRGEVGCSEQGGMLKSSGESDAITPDTKCFGFSQSEQQGGSRCAEGVFEGVCSQQPIADTECEGAWQFTSKNCRRKDGRFNDISQDGDVTDSEGKGFERQCRKRDDSSISRGDEEFHFRSENQLNASDTDSNGLQGGVLSGGDGQQGWDRPIFSAAKYLHTHGGSAIQNGRWHDFPTQSAICSRNDGIPGGLDGITFSKWRNESIKGYGNAVVVPLVEVIFKAINQYREKYEHQ